MRWAVVSAGLLAAGCSGNDSSPGVERVDAVINDMQTRYDTLRDRCDHRALFALTYLRTTEMFRQALDEPEFFREPAFVIDLDVAFARLYFEAFDAWETNGTSGVPPAWTVGFEATTTSTLSTFGDVLVGVSAHINRDLALALVEVGLESPEGVDRKRDHDKVNEFLARVEVTAEIQHDFDPNFDADYASGLPFIEAWRESAWQRAVELVAAADREPVLAVHEVEAEDSVNAIRLIYGLNDGETTQVRDRHCMSRGR